MAKNFKVTTAVKICFMLTLFGCQCPPKQQTVDLTPLSTQIGNLSDANAGLKVTNDRLQAANTALQAENEHLKAMFRADADAGLAANGKGWLPFEKYVWKHQISLLPSVAPDAATSGKWNEASTLYAAGGESAMQGVIKDLQASAGTLNTQLGKAQEAVKAAQAERDKLQQAVDAALKRAQEAEQNLVSAVAKAKADEDARIAAETRAWQVHAANWAGGALGILALACIAGMIFLSAAISPFRKAAVVCGAGCVICFAFARFAASDWFMPVTLSVTGLALSGWAAWEIRAAIKRKEATKKAGEASMVANTIISALDTYYDTQASTEAKADMDAKLWPALEAVGPAYAAAVNRIKAAQCDEKALAK